MSNFIFISKIILNGDVCVRHCGCEHILVPSQTFDPRFWISYYGKESFFICTGFSLNISETPSAGRSTSHARRDGWLNREIFSCQNPSSFRWFILPPVLLTDFPNKRLQNWETVLYQCWLPGNGRRLKFLDKKKSHVEGWDEAWEESQAMGCRCDTCPGVLGN